MPEYGDRTYKSGFYKNIKQNGVNDRVYGAEDIRKPYDVLYSDGIKPDADGTAGDYLKVEPVSGMQLKVTRGFAKLGGAWFENKSDFLITLDNPSAETRYDCIIISNDDSDSVRDSSIAIRSVYSLDEIAVTQSGNLYEICVGYVTVDSSTYEIEEVNITDTRGSKELCPIMNGVGATVVRTLKSTYFTERENQTSLPIRIDGYNPDTDELEVWVEGNKFTEGSQYTIVSYFNITVTLPLPVTGTKVEFVVRKNVNGAVNESTNIEVTQLINDVANIKNTLSHDYYCGGVNDNVLISNLVKELLTGSGYGSVRLNVHGTFGAYVPAIVGSTTDYWFDFSGTSDRKVVVDFTDCSQIITPVTDGKTSVIFYGKNINIVGANLIVNNTTTNTSIVVFDGSAEKVNCENSRFWITGHKYSYIARTGTFTNCRGSVTNTQYYSYCFYTNGLVRINGGEYYAYTADFGSTSAVVGHEGTDAITIMYGVNAPTVERDGYYQNYSVMHISVDGVISCTDLISTLEIQELTGNDNFRGTIELNKPNMM